MVNRSELSMNFPRGAISTNRQLYMYSVVIVRKSNGKTENKEIDPHPRYSFRRDCFSGLSLEGMMAISHFLVCLH